MSKFLNERINSLTPYEPGEQPKQRQYVKLNTNESPYPPSKLGLRLAKAQAKISQLYPDPNCTELTVLLAKELGVKENQVILTNGSDEVLNFAFMAYCDQNTPAVYNDITYGFYKVYAKLNGVESKVIPLKDDFSIDVDAFIKEKGTIIIANPNAPTGLLLSLSEIERILSSDPNRVVVIDEAYIDFGGESAVKLINKYENLLVTQTFSKSRSLAGSRLGFGVGNENLIADLMRIKYSTNPYNVNRLTMAMGMGAVLDKAYFEKNCKSIIKNRENAKLELEKLGFFVTNSKANFLFAKSDKIDGKNLYLKLKEKGILVRHFDSDRIREYIRITVGSSKDMQELISATKSILEEL